MEQLKNEKTGIVCPKCHKAIKVMNIGINYGWEGLEYFHLGCGGRINQNEIQK